MQTTTAATALNGTRDRKNHHLYYSQEHVSSRFGHRLKELRESRNLTQMQLALKCGIDRTYVSNLERGRSSISLFLLEVIAIGFGMSLSELLGPL